MTLLLDEGFAVSAASILRSRGMDAVHVKECGLGGGIGSDRDIIAKAVETGRTIVTLDSDFHTILALSGATFPSVVFIRIDKLHAQAAADLIQRIATFCRDDIQRGAAITITSASIRTHFLPIRTEVSR